MCPDCQTWRRGGGISAGLPARLGSARGQRGGQNSGRPYSVLAACSRARGGAGRGTGVQLAGSFMAQGQQDQPGLGGATPERGTGGKVHSVDPVFI